MSSVFLFGAGASYGSGPCHPYPPPLGTQLFSALQALGGVAATVNEELAQLFFRNFEEGMDAFWLTRNTSTTELLREMARYFVQFEPLPGNCYLELFSILGGTRKKAVFATTNYDLLIEHAICQSGLLIAYTGLPVSARNVPVLKIHGSCNFLPNLKPRQISGIAFDLSESKGGAILETGVRVAKSAQEVLQFCDTEDSVAPALAMYSPSKQVLFCRGFVQEQQDALLHALNEAARVYVIGLRVHVIDEHIWGPLSKSKVPLYYVGFEPEDFASWVTSNKRSNAYVLSDSFRNALPKIALQHGR